MFGKYGVVSNSTAFLEMDDVELVVVSQPKENAVAAEKVITKSKTV